MAGSLNDVIGIHLEGIVGIRFPDSSQPIDGVAHFLGSGYVEDFSMSIGKQVFQYLPLSITVAMKNAMRNKALKASPWKYEGYF
ncbi:hypothetical protein SDC9_143239 [bioreactor metagenome]|uniref:Uncharacterized protein n=1 Tax=bioreactor metagenome TaxID=1076179 RepID=A0A645E6A1_9ZZZZ